MINNAFSRSPVLRYLWETILVFVLGFGAVKAGLWLAAPPYYTSPLWPASGIATGLVLIFGIRHVATLLIAFLLGFYSHEFSTIELFFSDYLITITMSALGAFVVTLRFLLIKYFIKADYILFNPAAIARLLLILVFSSVLIFLGLEIFFRITEIMPMESIRPVVLAWTGADLTGSLIFIPFMLSLRKRYSVKNRSGNFIEYFLFAAVIFSTILFIFLLKGLYSQQLSYILIPFFFWVAFRFNMRDTTISLVIVAILATYITMQSTHHNIGRDFFYSIYFFQLYLFVTTPIFLFINALSSELRLKKFKYSLNLKPDEEHANRTLPHKGGYLAGQPGILLEAITQSPGTVIVTDADGIILYANPAFTEITGYTVDEVLGKNPRILKSDYHTQEFYEEMWGSIKSGNIWKGRFLNKKKDGSLYWEKATIAPIKDKEIITHFVCTKEDVTSREQAVEALKASENQLRTLTENAPVIISEIDLDGRIIYINRELKGLSPSKIVGKTIYSLLDQKYHPQAFENFALSFKGRIITSFEVQVEHPDFGQQFFDVVIAPLLDDVSVNKAILIMQDITEVIQSRQEVQESERKYRLLAENVADIIWVMDEKLNYNFVSPSILEITGYSVSEIMALPLRKYLPGLSYNFIQVLNKYRKNQVKNTSEVSEGKWETQFIKKDGSRIWLESKIKPIVDRKGNFNGLIGVSRDITKRKNSEDALRTSEEKFRSFFLESSAMILLIDPTNGRIEEANHSAIEFYKYTQEEFNKLSLYDIDVGSKESVQNTIKSILEKKYIQVGMRHKLKSGLIKDVNMLPTIVKIGGKEIIFAIIQDITRRKKAIEALKESESKKLALLKIIPDLIFVINRKGIILDVYTDSPSDMEVPPDKLMGRRFFDTMPDEISSEFIRNIEKAFDTQGIITFEYSYQRKESRTFEEARLISSGRNELLIILRDISELKQSEIELKRAWQEAEYANTAKSAFLANMSHEIRTPINSVIGFTELLARELPRSHYSSYLESIKSSSKTLLSLIDDILDLSKIEAGELTLRPEFIKPRAILDEISNVFMLKMKQKKLSIQVNVEPNVPEVVLLDELRLRQILINLVGNAFKFTDKGTVTVSLAAGEVHLIDNIDYVDLILSVSDTGIGIPEEYQEMIFEAFKQQDEQDSRKYGGTGLGLAITKRLVQLMDGNIRLDSKLGEGSTFQIFLPNLQMGSKTKVKKVSKSVVGTVMFTKGKVLIADDVDINRELLRGILKGKALQIEEAIDGEDTIAKLEKDIPDLLLLDLNMPKKTGFEVAEYMRNTEAYKNIPIIAISATKISSKEKERAKHFDVFLSKPFKVADLLSILKKYLPHEEIKPNLNSNSSRSKQLISISSYTKKDILNLKQKISQLKQELTAVAESSSFDEINTYAKSLSALVSKYKIPILKVKVAQIVTAAENFDIEEINQSLNDMPEIFNQLLHELNT